MSKKPKVTIKNEVDNPHKNHRQRVRNRYIKGGLDVFADHEILEMLLYNTIPRKDTNKLAHRILKEFGSLHAVFEAKPSHLMTRIGLTEPSAVLLSMMSQISVRYQYDKWDKKIVFKNSNQLARYAIIPFKNQTVECFYMMCLDKSFALRAFEELESGTIDKVELQPRTIVDYALRNNSSYVVLAHNHPSGCDVISDADISSTVDIMQYLQPFNIRVIDHIIAISGDNYISFAEKGISKFSVLESLNKEREIKSQILKSAKKK
ncbi:MAG: hypothetical protein FWE44_07770 [Defluviitaleaceae bacterium]|nr:hypothetical protein [Defluviitaleaceae bacterium]